MELLDGAVCLAFDSLDLVQRLPDLLLDHPVGVATRYSPDFARLSNDLVVSR